MEPEEITVIVHGARGLQGKKPGRHKYSVIFGLGGKKYRTDVVKDPTGCPDWNEESTIKVYNAEDNVFFTVTEKEDILGHLSFPVMSLQTTKGRVIKASLQPHRKCPAPQGELIYQLYISKCRNLDGSPVIKGNTMTNEPTRPLRGFAKLKHNLATKPLLPHKFHRTKHSGSGNKSSTLSNLNKKFSQSLHDLFNISRGVVVDNEDSDDEGSISVKPAMNGHLRSRAVSVNYMEEIGQEPELTAVTPSEAPTTGGTQLVIIGKHLGAELAEISRLSICGCDCLDTLDYESPMRLYCRTKQWKAGKGDVVIETLSGGSHVLKNYFTFVQKGPVLDDVDGLEESSTTDPPVILNGNTPNGETTGPSESLSSQNFKLGKSMPNLTDMGKDTDGDQKKPLFIRKSNETTDNKYTKNKKDGKGVKQHQRRSSEATAFTRDDNNRRSWSKSELVGEIKKLEEENKQLKHDNDDMKIYIEKLVAKVMIHCPEVLNMADDDEKL